MPTARTARLLLGLVAAMLHSSPLPEATAYNFPEESCSCNFWGDVSFIYWQPTQDNMEMGLALESVSAVCLDEVLVRGATSTEQSRYVNMDFRFIPGFKAGLGSNIPYDGWDWSLEYTWLHGQDKKASAGGAYGLATSFADSQSMDILLGPSSLFYGPGTASRDSPLKQLAISNQSNQKFVQRWTKGKK